MSPFPHVFSPIKVGPVQLANRFYIPSHGIYPLAAPGPKGSLVPSQGMVDYYAERAAAGVGLLFHSMPVIPRQRLTCPLYEESIPAFRAVARGVHANGAKLFGQLHYYWGHTVPWDASGATMIPVLGPSSYQRFEMHDTVHEMSIADIKEFQSALGQCVRNLRSAGYDGIQVHAAHGMLHEQFLSPYFNQRTDEYGGDLTGRMHFLIESLRIAREAAGPDMAVGIRFNCDEMLPSGLTQTDTREILTRLVDEGLLDYVDLDVAVEPMQAPFMTPPVSIEPMFYTSFVGAVGQAVKGRIVVMGCAGRLTRIAQAEKLIADGVADMIGGVRGLIAEPELVRNAQAGHEERSRTCIACNVCIGANSKAGLIGAGCLINPATFRETQWGVRSFAPAAHASTVVVVGGGPAGLEAARVAALNGHKVVLFERRTTLGGQLNLWAQIPGRDILAGTRDWFRDRLTELGVDIRLGVNASAADILALRPGAVILATGSAYSRSGESGFMPTAIPGIASLKVHTPEDVLESGARPTGRVIVLDEEGMFTGFGVAEVLAGAGAQVEVVTRDFSTISPLVYWSLDFPFVYARMKGLGVRVTTGTWIKEFAASSAVLFDILNNEETTREIDAIVLATMRRPQGAHLAKALEGNVRQVFQIGDALSPRGFFEATYEGHRFARFIGEEGAPRTSTEAIFRPSPDEWSPRPATIA